MPPRLEPDVEFLDVEFLAQLPVSAVLDGELVAFDADDKPDFVSLCERMLHGRAEISMTFLVFDVLSVDARRTKTAPPNPGGAAAS